MPKIICTVPERVLSEKQILVLEESFRQVYADQLESREEITIAWYRLPDGQSFVAGSPGEVYIALVEVVDGLEQSKREEAMMAFTRAFADGASVEFEKPLVSLLDSAKVSEYLGANRGRLRLLSRPGFLLGTLLHASRSRKRDGFVSLRANL